MRYLLPLLSLLMLTPVQGALVNRDFLTPGDGLLVYDSVTNFEWLTPVYTRGQTYNNAIIQDLLADHGLRYATSAEVINMILNNFGPITTVSPGDAAGFASANSFFGYFGIAANTFCSGIGPCPRTQGLTSTPGTPFTHLGFGLITFPGTGWLIQNNNWADNSVDQQMGSFLVRTGSAVPEPGTLALLGTALLVVGIRRRL